MTVVTLVVTGALLIAGARPAAAVDDGARCRPVVARALAGCVAQVGAVAGRCYRRTGIACPAGEPQVAGALDTLERLVLDRCADANAVAAAGYAPLEPAELVTWLESACARGVAAIAARAFGGAAGALLSAGDAAADRCLFAAARAGTKLVGRSLRTLGHCAGVSCNPNRVGNGLDRSTARAAARIKRRCANLPVLVGLTAKDFARDIQEGVASIAAAPCDPLDTTRCLFPFPNDFFSGVDPTTPTGRRIAITSVAMPVNDMGVAVDPTAWNELDGFSVGPQALFDFPALDLDVTGVSALIDISRSLDPDAPVVLIDAESGERQLHWVERDQTAAAAHERALMLRVGRNLANGRRFIVALRDVRDADGALLPASPTFAAYRDRTPTGQLPVEARRAHMEDIFGILEDAGIERDALVLAWDFTTQSADSTARKLLHMRDDAFQNVLGADAPGFQVNSVVEPLDGRIFRRVDGTFQSPLYLTNGGAPGSLLRRGVDGLPLNQGDFVTAQFRCVIPFAATTAGGPPAVPARAALYGHGLLGDESETSAGHVRDMANEHNFVFCGTAWSGFSEADLGTVVNLILDFSNFAKFTEHQHQGILNFMVLGRLLTHPDGFARDPAFQVGGESVIDPSGLFFDGNSQGGIMGGALAAVAQDIERFVLGVPGMNYSTLLSRSSDFAPFFEIIRGTYPNGLDRALLLSIGQMLWDQVDPSGHSSHLTADTYPDTPPKKILYQVAFGDHQVAPVTVEVAARSIGARLHQPALAPTKIVPELVPYYDIPAISSYPFDGSAVVIWDSGNPAPPVDNLPPAVIQSTDPEWGDLSPCAQAFASDPHECPRRQPAARLQKSEFLKNGGAVIDVCAGGPCFAPSP
jgi:hypothetical protein